MYGLAHTGVSMVIYGGAALVALIVGGAIKLRDYLRRR